jgi:HlyD family secretion protein
MKSKIRTIPFILSILILIFTAGCTSTLSQTLQVSGLIEAEAINVAPELSGRVVEVLVNEGASVKTGDVLFRLDGSLLQAEKQATEATLDSAKAGLQTAQVALDTVKTQYDLTLAAALEQEKNLRLQTWVQENPAEFAQPAWYFKKSELQVAVQAEVDAAQQALNEAQAALEAIEKQAGSTAFLSAENDLNQARVAFQVAKGVLDQANKATDGEELRKAAQSALDDARSVLTDAQDAYDDSLITDGSLDVLAARAKVAVAQESYDSARDALRALQTGAQSPEVILAGKAVEQAQAAVTQAQTAVAQVEANLDLLNLQMEKLDVLAPIDGVILTLGIRKGEVIQAGLTGLTIADLVQLKVTVYLPEDRYAQVNLGDQVKLHGDSFPDETFTAVVTRIADRAEYTPRNVQTSEERQTTVYALELSLDNPDGKLKPGMPVDVTFSE